MRAVDAILATLQTAFAQPSLVNGENPYRFNAADRVNSTLWISDAEGRLATERGGSRCQILVDRSDYTPQDLHLHGFGGLQNADPGNRFFTDLGGTTVVIYCEGGNRFQSETLAAISYQVIKAFRHDIMREFELHNVKPLSVSTAQPIEGVTGRPWRTTVAVQVLTQEKLVVSELANLMNHLDLVSAYKGLLDKHGVERVDGGVQEPGFDSTASTPPNP